MDRQKMLEHVRRIILEVSPRLSPSHITESSSMTNELGLDHPHLEVLFTRLQAEVVKANLPFTPWYTRALRPGQDTVGSMVDFLIELKGKRERMCLSAWLLLDRPILAVLLGGLLGVQHHVASTREGLGGQQHEQCLASCRESDVGRLFPGGPGSRERAVREASASW